MPLFLLGPPEQVQLRAGHCPRQLQPSGHQILFFCVLKVLAHKIYFLWRLLKLNVYFLYMRKWFLNLQDAFSKSKINIKFPLAPLKTLTYRILNAVPEAAHLKFLPQLFFSAVGQFCFCFSAIGNFFLSFSAIGRFSPVCSCTRWLTEFQDHSGFLDAFSGSKSPLSYWSDFQN